MDATPGITGSLAAISRRVSQPLRNDRGMGVIGMRHVGRKCRFIANIMPKPGHSTARSDRAAWGPAAAPTGPSDTYLRPLARVLWRRDGPCCVARCFFFVDENGKTILFFLLDIISGNCYQDMHVVRSPPLLLTICSELVLSSERVVLSMVAIGEQSTSSEVCARARPSACGPLPLDAVPTRLGGALHRWHFFGNKEQLAGVSQARVWSLHGGMEERGHRPMRLLGGNDIVFFSGRRRKDIGLV